MAEEPKQEPNESLILANEIYSFKELVSTIIEYYSFKNNIYQEEDSSGDEWKKGTKYDDNVVVPEKLDKLIEKSFESQIKRFL